MKIRESGMPKELFIEAVTVFNSLKLLMNSLSDNISR
jgi:hypothetical protein